MAYLLILPASLYIALATMVLHRRPRSLSYLVLAFYAITVALATAGYTVLGTTHNEPAARVAAVVVIVAGSWAYMALMPLALLGLYFERWFETHRRPVLIAAAAGQAVILCGMGVLAALDTIPLVVEVRPHYWSPWILTRIHMNWRLGVLLLLAGQVPSLGVIGAALHRCRLSFWRGAVAIVVVNVSSILLPLLAPLTGAYWAAVVIAMGYAPPVVLYALLLIRAARVAVLDAVIASTLTRYDDALLVLDADQRVVWHNARATHWIAHQSSELAPQPVRDVLRGTLLLAAVQELLTMHSRSTEIELVQDGEEYALRLEVHPLDDVRYVPGAQLVIIRDMTATRVLLNLHAQRAGLLALSAISADIASTLDLNQVIARALQQAQHVIQADMSSVYLVDPDEPAHLVRAGHVVGPAAAHLHDLIPPQIPIRGTTAGWVVQHAQPIFTPDATVDPEDGARLTKVGLRAGASVPLIARNKVIGVLQMGMVEPREFDPVAIALIESVGRQLGVALDNARLHAQERHQRQVAQTLSAIAGILTTYTLDDALQALLDLFHELVDFERGSVLLEVEPGQLGISAHFGFDNVPPDGSLNTVRIPITKYDYLQSLFQERTPQLVPDTSADPRWQHGAHKFGSWIGVPLVIHGQVLGLLSISHHQPGHFTEQHLKLAATFADQAVIAVENARLFDAEHRRRAQAEFLQQASYDLVSSADLDSALSMAITMLANALHFDHARIGLIDEERKVWVSRVTYPDSMSPQHGPVLPLDYYPLVGKMVRDQEPFLIHDTRDEPLWISSPPGEPEIRSWIGVPLIARGRTVGILNLYSGQPHAFTEEQFNTVRLFANQIAAALENFRLMDATTRQNQVLSALNTILATSTEALTEHDRVLDVTLTRVLDTLQLPGGVIHRYDAASKRLHLAASSGLPVSVQEQLRHIPVSDTMTLAPVTVGDTLVLRFFSVPLVAHGHTIGLLSILRPTDQPLEDTTRAQLDSIGRQLGVVLDNAILFEATTRRAALSTNLNRLSLALSAQLDRDTVLTMLCQESLGVFDAQGAYIWLVEGETLSGVEASGPGADQFPGHDIDVSTAGGLLAQVASDWRPRVATALSGTLSLPGDLAALVPDAQAVLAVPLLKGKILMGVLLLVNTRTPQAFGAWMLEQAAVLGVQGALALQNATLFDEARRRVDQLRLVNEASRYATAILSLPHLSDSVVRMLAEALHFDLVGLLEATPTYPEFQTLYSTDESLSGPAFDTLKDRLLAIAAHATHAAEPQLENVTWQAESPETICTLLIPMIIADEVTGLLLVARRGANSLNTGDLDVLEPLAAQVSTAVSNARLYEKVRKQTVALEARVAQRTAEIRRQHERTEAILHSVADAVIVFDLQAQVVLTNPVARALFDKHDLTMDLGTRVRQLVAPILSGEHEEREFTDIYELGPVTLQALAAPVLEDDLTTLGAVVVMRDISELRELDRMKDMFVSNVSHELRTPLANLKLYLSLLEQGRPERHTDYMDVMRREVERLERLISDLLQISRLRNEKHVGAPQIRLPMNLAGLIENVIRGSSARAQSEGKMLRHECDTSPLPPGYGNPDQIIRALMNLVGNALAYTETGDSIIVRSRAEPAGQKKPEWVIIEVVDNGMGIPTEELHTIFERFYRGSNVSPTISGTGLGLAIVKDIIDLHKGRIEVESTEGQGSTFRIALPVYDGGSSETLVEKDV